MAKGKGNGAGRPLKIDKETRSKLEFMFSCNGNKTEACLYAGVSTKTLERYLENNPEFSLRIKELRSNPRMTAKVNVNEKLKGGCIDTSKFVLTHTDPEYKLKSKVENEHTVNTRVEFMKALKKENDDP